MTALDQTGTDENLLGPANPLVLMRTLKRAMEKIIDECEKADLVRLAKFARIGEISVTLLERLEKTDEAEPILEPAGSAATRLDRALREYDATTILDILERNDLTYPQIESIVETSFSTNGHWSNEVEVLGGFGLDSGEVEPRMIPDELVLYKALSHSTAVAAHISDRLAEGGFPDESDELIEPLISAITSREPTTLNALAGEPGIFVKIAVLVNAATARTTKNILRQELAQTEQVDQVWLDELITKHRDHVKLIEEELELTKDVLSMREEHIRNADELWQLRDAIYDANRPVFERAMALDSALLLVEAQIAQDQTDTLFTGGGPSVMRAAAEGHGIGTGLNTGPTAL